MYRRRYESRRSSKPKCIKNKNKIKYVEKRFSICRMEFLQPAMWHDHDIDFVRWLHPAVWHEALESWQWIHQVAAPAMWHVAVGCAIEFAQTKHPPYWNSTSGFYFHTSPQSTCHSVPVCEILSKSDHPRQKKWRHVDFQDGGSQLSWILGVQ